MLYLVGSLRKLITFPFGDCLPKFRMLSFIDGIVYTTKLMDVTYKLISSDRTNVCEGKKNTHKK